MSGGDYPHRPEPRERRTGWDVGPTPRTLWVGNLSPHVTETLLLELFIRFGDVESVAHAPRRVYAFINFVRAEDAAVAYKDLQGHNVAGAPLRIEFAKEDRVSRGPISFHDEEQPAYNEGRHSNERGESQLHKYSRSQRSGPERKYDDSRENKNTEPSEILWVGFPTFLDIDDVALSRAFSPFGEIDKITTFPGRSYAFVRYTSVVAACRAKEALHGKLFNNPRVGISFAKSDIGPAKHDKSTISAYFPPNFRSNFHPGLSGQGQGVEPLQRKRNFDSPMKDIHMESHMDRMSVDSNREFGRNSSVQTGAGLAVNFSGSHERVRLQDEGLERRTAENAYERHEISPTVERGAQWCDLPFEISWRTPHHEEAWGAEDVSFPLAKKLKTDSFPDKELPEYPFSDITQEKHDSGLPRLFPSFTDHHHAYNKNFDSIPFGHKGVSDSSRNLTHLHAETDDSWRAYDGFRPGPGTLSLNPVKLKRIDPEPYQPPPNKEWRWEGTIAKGGTPVCRARCFPVGKVPDLMLPKILNCTARTDLDMLAKHYYQAASTWVVFFVPETDADIVFYNEFLNYLGEKQRIAVAKLDEKITLFLVPPSEFSEQVLKVPGKMSISGVILRFQQSSSNFNSLHYPPEVAVSKPPSVAHWSTDGVKYQEDTSLRRPSSPDVRPSTQGQNYFSSSSGLVAPVASTFPPPNKSDANLPYSGSVPAMEKVPNFHVEIRQNQHQHRTILPSNWPVHLHPNSTTESFAPPTRNAASHSSDHSIVEEYPFANSKFPHETTSTNNAIPFPNATSDSFDNSMVEHYPFENSKVPNGTTPTSNASETLGVSLPASKFALQQDVNTPVPSSLSVPLQPEQFAQLAALFGQQKQSGKLTMLSTNGGQPSMSQNPSLPPQVSTPSISVVSQFRQMQQWQQHSSNVSTDHSQQLPQPSNTSVEQFGEAQQLSQHASSVSSVQPVVNPPQQSNHQASNSSQEETEADPQKRLQATLQLAAALLQQIQQQAKTGDH